MRLRIAVFLLFSLLLGGLQLPPAHASLSSTLQWEIRTTGASSNGGAFRTGATGGTDYSQQNSAQFTYTDLAATSIAAPAAGPTVNSSTTGGSIPNGTWYVVVTYVVDGGETTASPQTSITISSGTGTNKINVSSPSGVTGVPRYRVYIGTVSGGPYYFQTD